MQVLETVTLRWKTILKHLKCPQLILNQTFWFLGKTTHHGSHWIFVLIFPWEQGLHSSQLSHDKAHRAWEQTSLTIGSSWIKQLPPVAADSLEPLSSALEINLHPNREQKTSTLSITFKLKTRRGLTNHAPRSQENTGLPSLSVPDRAGKGCCFHTGWLLCLLWERNTDGKILYSPATTGSQSLSLCLTFFRVTPRTATITWEGFFFLPSRK